MCRIEMDVDRAIALCRQRSSEIYGSGESTIMLKDVEKILNDMREQYNKTLPTPENIGYKPPEQELVLVLSQGVEIEENKVISAKDLKDYVKDSILNFGHDLDRVRKDIFGYIDDHSGQRPITPSKDNLELTCEVCGKKSNYMVYTDKFICEQCYNEKDVRDQDSYDDTPEEVV